ncbi:hypothetical protein ACILFN_10395 [Capnocytophaga canimorsus]|uniref:hypothetical protein n=1 Tax=Capnocytophaga canimorsus TaxID=28188 RepID=UPI0037CD195A
MRKLLFFAFLFTLSSIYACSCEYPPFMERYIKADLVARVKIVKNHLPQSEYYKSEIETLELFKGKPLTEIYVWGVGTSCEMYISESTEAIIFAYEDKNGKYTIDACCEIINLSEKFTDFDTNNTEFQSYINRVENSKNRKIEVLRFLKSKKIDFTSKIEYSEIGLHEALKKFDGAKFKKRFAIFEIAFTHDVKIKSIKKISGFGRKIDKEIIDILKNIQWSSYDKGIKNKIPEGSKTLIGLYHIEEDFERSNFITYFL